MFPFDFEMFVSSVQLLVTNLPSVSSAAYFCSFVSSFHSIQPAAHPEPHSAGDLSSLLSPSAALEGLLGFLHSSMYRSIL